MKGKAGRPHIPLSTISNRKSDGLTASPDITADTAPTGATAGAMARGGAPKKRADKKARGGGVHIKKSHKGLLHKNLGVPAGEKIPEAKMEKAKKSASPAEKKRITFAENASKWGKK